MRPNAIVLAALLSLSAASGATSPLAPTSWGVVYDVPATAEVTLRADVPYLEARRAG